MKTRDIDLIKILEAEREMFGKNRGVYTDESIFPWLSFPEWIDIQVIYPFFGAAARFRARNKNDHNKYVSVYLDIYDLLGFYGSPYWEVYPDSNGSVFRCDRDETKVLTDKICELLK